jgi:hypothetical protein
VHSVLQTGTFAQSWSPLHYLMVFMSKIPYKNYMTQKVTLILQLPLQTFFEPTSRYINVNVSSAVFGSFVMTTLTNPAYNSFRYSYWTYVYKTHNSLAVLLHNIEDAAKCRLLCINPLALELDIYIVAHHLCKMWIFYEPKKGSVMKYTTFCRGINSDCLASLKKNNEI